jgi:SpoVK/Ycf46/Vps4 family AAA+-type ATPase
VDPKAESLLNKQSDIDDVTVNNLEVYAVDSRSHQPFNLSSFSDEDYSRCPATQYVFDLDDHGWYSVNVMDVKPKQWKPESFDRLVMDASRKSILQRITTTSLDTATSASHDAIEGKGRGLVLLLHGPPGVGKTMTAEALAELTKRPLLKVNLGRLSSHKKWEQALEQVFDNGEAWKAILLIDEAEVVLEKRTFERMVQNSWISVFLRKLEYYQGVLILTTNLVDCMDDAFESRISYPIHFEELSQEDRRQIWIGFIEHLSTLDRYKKELLQEVDKWSEAEINGRQIRNIFTMAENLCSSDGKSGRLTAEHIDKILDVTLEFTEYNRNKYSKKKKGYLTY